MHLTLKHLRILEAIARNRTITLAARETGLSQPAVSMQMKQLEEEVGEPLWERVNKQVYMTDTGKLVLAAARDILCRVAELEEEIEASRGRIVGELDIAVVTSAKHFLPRYLGDFVRRHPGVRPRLTVTNRATALEAIAENRHDIYIMGQVPDGLAINAVPFLDNILEVVASPEHSLGSRQNISLGLLAEEKFLVREPGSGTRITIDRLFGEQGLEVQPFMELGSSGAIKNAVIAGLGIAVLSRHSLEFELKSNAIIILDAEGFPLTRRWYAVYPQGKHLSPAAGSFLEFLTRGKPLA
jgi:DNA-binding transcriptional LysR family regulator